MQLIIKGHASKSVVKKIPCVEQNIGMTLLQVLRDNDVPIASSCDGQKVCELCTIKLNNKSRLACEEKLSSHSIDQEVIIEVAYL